VEDYLAVEPFPHQPLIPRHDYVHPAPSGGNGVALARLLDRFSPASDIDADLIKAFFLTLLWGGQPGSRPAWLFTAERDDPKGGRGLGKTTVAKMGAREVGGHTDLCKDDRMSDILTRLLSPDALNCRVVILDNVKTLKFSWGDFERLVTIDTISGRRLYHGEGHRPNTITYCITLNGASLSKDVAQRCVIVELKRPEFDGAWEEETAALIERDRWAIIGDILAALKAPAEPLKQHSRWGAWEDAVLARVAEPSDCQKVILERQEAVDDDAEEAGLVRDFFRSALRGRGHDPDRDAVFIPTATASAWVNEATNEKRPTNIAGTHLGTLTIGELRKSKRDGARGWAWRGKQAPVDAAMCPLSEATGW
jgi:hypothetical protein